MLAMADVEEKAFLASKNLLTSSSLLVHLNPDLELVLMYYKLPPTDLVHFLPSVCAVLAHHMPDGSE